MAAKAKGSTARGRGRPAKKVESGEKRPRTIYISRALDRRLRIYAAENETSVSAVIAEALASYLPRK